MIPYGGQGWGPKGTKEDAKWVWWFFAIICTLLFIGSGFTGEWIWGLGGFAAALWFMGWLQRFTS
jgi:hypothetical protein